MPTEILMPALSPTMEEGKLAKWLVKEGQTIKPGDIIAEIETDKATMEVEAVDEGKVSKLLVAEGTEGVKVNTPIAVLDGEAAAPGKPKRASKSAPPTAKSTTRPPPPGGEGLGVGGQRDRRGSPPPQPSPTRGRGFWRRKLRGRRRSQPPAPKPPRRPCARRCAMPWPRRCAATLVCS